MLVCSLRSKAFPNFGPREKWGKSKKVERAGWGWGKKVSSFSLPHPPPSTFLLSPHFSCSPNAKNTLSRGPNFVVRERLLRRLASLARFSRLNLAATLDSRLTLSVAVRDGTTSFNLLDFLKRSAIEAIRSQYTGIAEEPTNRRDWKV